MNDLHRPLPSLRLTRNGMTGDRQGVRATDKVPPRALRLRL